ncbi:hypothetical protein [Tardiphaga alba]|nr:hypothetical protein [Tardiphaga alba]
MRQPNAQRSFTDELRISLREPAGIVCAALSLALITVIARIATVW